MNRPKTAVRRVKIEAGSRTYRVVIGPGLLSTAGRLIEETGQAGKCLIVTDKKVAGLHLERLLEALNNSPVEATCTLFSGRGESRKTLSTVAGVYRALCQGQFYRDDLVINLSGGMLGDLAGYAAATFMRGMRWIQFPTTLLSQVDASVGGKVGVNLPQGKNLVGTFYQPWMVVCDTEALMTLPERTYRSGLAEVVKLAVAFDRTFFELLRARRATVANRDPDILAEVIERSVTLKANVVGRDEQEHGYRMTLNYGHTLGHALEKAAGYRSLTHGEAVSLGMCAAAELAHELGLLSERDVTEQCNLLQSFGLPVRLSGNKGKKVRTDEVLAAVSADKKHRHGGLRLVLPTGIGTVEIQSDVPVKTMERVFRVFLERG